MLKIYLRCLFRIFSVRLRNLKPDQTCETGRRQGRSVDFLHLKR